MTAQRLPRPRHLRLVPDQRPRFGTVTRRLRANARVQAPGQLELDQVLRVALTSTGLPLFVLPGGHAPVPDVPVAAIARKARAA